MIGDGQRVTVFLVTKEEFPLVVGAPKLIRLCSQRQRGAFSISASPSHAFDQTMTVQHGVDGASGGNFDLAGKTAKQFLPDLPRTPMRLISHSPRKGKRQK